MRNGDVARRVAAWLLCAVDQSASAMAIAVTEYRWRATTLCGTTTQTALQATQR